MNAYEKGFMDKCAAFGINPTTLTKQVMSPIERLMQYITRSKKPISEYRMPDYHVDDPPMSPGRYRGDVGQSN